MKSKLELHKKVCENKDFWNIVMLSEDIKIFNHYQKSDKTLCITFADLECSIEKIDGCKYNPKNSSTTKVGKHIPSRFSMSAMSSFKSIGNKHDVYRGKDCMEKFCESLREHKIEIIYFKTKKLKLLTNEQQK